MRALVWFRRDLRVSDQPALHAASQQAADGVVAIYLLAPRQWREHNESPVKIACWLRTLEVLKQSLVKLGIPLLIRESPTFAEAPHVLLETAAQAKCSALLFNDEYEINERRRDDAVEQAAVKAGLKVRRFSGRVVAPPGTIRARSGSFHSVFTPFRKRWLEWLKDNDTAPLPAPPAQQAIEDVAGDAVPSRIEGFDADENVLAQWPAGEPAAQRRLEQFIAHRIDRYHTARDMPALDATSGLSPYLAAGSISARQCLHAAMQANRGRAGSGRRGPVSWITELVWREFYQHILYAFPRVSMNEPFRRQMARVPWRDDEASFAAWCDGRTGYPIVDAAMRQLRQAGWMHNRLRMITAMFLSKHLLMDWRLGERHFMRHLIDGELGSNNGGWQWSASTGTDAAPYFRIFNPTMQSRRCDPEGAFIRRYCPELRDLDNRAIHEPHADGGLFGREALDYPDPIVDHAAARKRAIEAYRSVSS